VNLRLDPHALYEGLVDSAKDELKETWNDLKAAEVLHLQQAASDFAILIGRRVRVADSPEKAGQVDLEIAHVKAQIANWTWVGADKVRARWEEWLKQAAEKVGEILKTVAKGLIA
jgi:hypothetical protein